VLVRTSIDIDAKPLFEAMHASGCRTKRATIEEGLRLLVRKKAYRGILALRGKVHWEGHPDVMRRSRNR
jgi:Arc/MetJ family transcription regulator